MMAVVFQKVAIVTGILMFAFMGSLIGLMSFVTYNAVQINAGILSDYSQVSYKDVGTLLHTNELLLSLAPYLLYAVIGFVIVFISTSIIAFLKA